MFIVFDAASTWNKQIIASFCGPLSKHARHQIYSSGTFMGVPLSLSWENNWYRRATGAKFTCSLCSRLSDVSVPFNVFWYEYNWIDLQSNLCQQTKCCHVMQEGHIFSFHETMFLLDQSWKKYHLVYNGEAQIQIIKTKKLSDRCWFLKNYTNAEA